MDQEPREGGLPLGELWFEVIPRFAAEILAACHHEPGRAEAATDADLLFRSLENACGQHQAAEAASRDSESTAERLGLGGGLPRSFEDPGENWRPAASVTGLSSETKVRRQVLARLADGSFVAWGHSDHSAFGEPRRPFTVDDWRGPPWRVGIVRFWVWRGARIGSREHVGRVLIYLRLAEPASYAPPPAAVLTPAPPKRQALPKLAPTRAEASDKIREEARALYAEFSDNPPNLLRAESLIRERLRGATRKPIRAVLAESEFKKLRCSPGRG